MTRGASRDIVIGFGFGLAQKRETVDQTKGPVIQRAESRYARSGVKEYIDSETR